MPDAAVSCRRPAAGAAPPDVRIMRVRDPARPPGRARLLVDRLWPRGVAKAGLGLDAWLPDLAPSHALRKWFNHDPARWDDFCIRYAEELDQRPEAVAVGLDWCRAGPVALLYAARDGVPNHATALWAYLTRHLEQEEKHHD